ncbi:hypothetical protein TNCV_4523431 [Trichonephila clavipes]|nr:hypothetical protein TNCV_4523431 [Trichonephila clavipes]
MSQEETQAITTGLEAMRKELSTVLGEIALIFCPVKDCPTHTNRIQSDSAMAETNEKSNDNNLKPKQNNNNPKEKIPKRTDSNIKIKTRLKLTKEQDRRILKLQIKSRKR